MKRLNHQKSVSLSCRYFYKSLSLLCLWSFVIFNLTRYSQLSTKLLNDSPNTTTIDTIIEQDNQYVDDDFNGIYNTKDFLESTLASQIINAFSSDTTLGPLYNNNNNQNKSIIYDKNTPQGKAFHWILNQDQYKQSKSLHNTQLYDPSDNPTILQRYILTLLYFATGGEYNNDIELGKRFTPDDNKVGHWTNYGTLRFLSKHLHECSWYDTNYHGSLKGVISCDHDTKEITELILPEVSIQGQLPEEIGYLTKLETLDLQNNHLYGIIPESIGQLTSLRTLGKLCMFALFG
jgi:hypothetical protein